MRACKEGRKEEREEEREKGNMREYTIVPTQSSVVAIDDRSE